MTLPFLDHLRRESDRFLDLLAEADPSARVPSCPEWAAADLLWHLAEVQWFWATIVDERRSSPEGLQHPERPTDLDALLTFAAQQSDRLVQVLTETPPETAVHMWAEDKTAGYVLRRQAHEALIHRLDAELTVDEVTPLDPALAADGVDECLAIMYGGIPEGWGTFTPAGAPVRVHLTDRSHADRIVQSGRFVGTDPDSGTAYDEDALALVGDTEAVETVEAVETAGTGGAATISGTAEDVDAWLWHRRGDDVLTFDGDPAAIDAVRGVLRRPLI